MNATQRIDQWLWHARFFKTRSLATKVCAARRIRLNGTPIAKPSTPVKPGDVLAFAAQRSVRVVKIVSLSVRRGPAAEAATLFEDLDPPPVRQRAASATAVPTDVARPPGAGRPTKAERRALDALRGRVRSP
jgi:ribosome-associated heat shock protein Hsp15